ncbi:GTP cyclohydrolase I FolE [candidate division KSB1 bacterium]|nr:GTP cyclohydrolase I FolE [candidate division KSB1 bacterium]MCH8286781.1 GTP cyclohydrolase I FolE [candidate division KSB1 bacterium]
MEDLIKDLLVKIGEDPDREGLQRTPKRVSEAFEFLTKGYSENLESLVNNAIFKENYDEMVLVKNIDIFSMCEHHLLPFVGVCHVGYIPDGKIIGLSKIPRIVEMFSRRLQVQERLTDQIAESIDSVLKPKGIGVVINARHLCMMMRGIEKQNTVVTTSSMLGSFKKNQRTRSEFLSLINQVNTTF